MVSEYEFTTASRELIGIHHGRINVNFSDNKDWTLITEGMDFNVPKYPSFYLEVLKLVTYTCSYFDEEEDYNNVRFITDTK